MNDFTYKVSIPKVLYLVLQISNHAKKAVYYNTNDLKEMANKYQNDVVRTRSDKSKENYLTDETKEAGLRGNLSTLLTFREYTLLDGKINRAYGVGKDDKLFNAVKKGSILLQADEAKKKYYCCTNNERLKEAIEQEKKLYNIRENQAHIKQFLEKNESIGLERDDSRSKTAVLKANKDVYFYRIIMNTGDKKGNYEFDMYNYLNTDYIKRKNIHPIFAVPTDKDSWGDIYAIDSKYILERTPLLMKYDSKNKKFIDENGNEYPFCALSDAIKNFPNENGNPTERGGYDWENVKSNIKKAEISRGLFDVEAEEYHIFVTKFFNFSPKFEIDGKTVDKFTVSSSGGADIRISFTDGSTATLELEHKWNNYLQHKHYMDMRWKDSWLYADEDWDFDKIKNIFSRLYPKYKACIPTMFLCVNSSTKKKEAYKVDWEEQTFESINIK